MEGILVIGFIIFLIFILSRPNKKKRSQHNLKRNIAPENQLIITDEFKDILCLLNNTNESVFITGKAGTGKSSLLKYFTENTRKKFVVLAPTGVAALNVSGQTIHSFFRFPPSIINPAQIQPDYVRADLFNNLQMVIIDEISMVRADLMNGIDIALRKNRNRLHEPFGGVQMVIIGDLFQLPPVLNNNEREIILEKFGGQYFFDAKVFKTFNYEFKELTIIFRQTNEHPEFRNLLNRIRNNEVQYDDMVLLNSRHKDNVEEHTNSVFLTTRKNIARSINNDKLANLPGQMYTYTGILSGKYLCLKEESEEKLEDKLPAPYKLELKKDAQIMMLKNDSAKRWVNGTIGIVDKLEQDSITIKIDGNKYRIERETWNEVEYILNKETKEIEINTIAGFTQFPIQLSYAMTIHKSQGKTFDKITIDVGSGAFAHGQIYVAVSRCRTLNGIILNNPIRNSDIIVDPRVIIFYETKLIPKQTPYLSQNNDRESIRDEVLRAISNDEKIRIVYENYNGEVKERILSNIQLTNEFEGYNNQHIKAFCHLRNEERSFRIDRIKKIERIKNT